VKTFLAGLVSWIVKAPRSEFAPPASGRKRIPAHRCSVVGALSPVDRDHRQSRGDPPQSLRHPSASATLLSPTTLGGILGRHLGAPPTVALTRRRGPPAGEAPSPRKSGCLLGYEMKIDKVLVPVSAGWEWSATWTVKTKNPWPGDTPEMTPVLAFRKRPPGRAPPTIDQL